MLALLLKPNILGLIFPWRTPTLGRLMGTQTPHFFGRTSASVINLLFVGRPPGCVSLDCTTSLPLLLTWLWFLLYIFSCIRSFLLVFRFLISSCSTGSCNFGVPVGGGELRVFLFYHLGHSGIFVLWLWGFSF